MYLHVYAKMQRNHSCTSKMRKPPNLTNSVMAPYFFIYANRNKAESREGTKQVVLIILRNRIFQGTIRHIRSGFSLYARTLCALTLLAYALKVTRNKTVLSVFINVNPVVLLRPKEKICVFPVTSPKKIRVGRSLFFFFFFLIFYLYFP